MTEKEWEKVHLGSIVEYSTFNLASFIFGGLIYGGYHDFHRTEVLGIRVDKKIYCKLDGKKKPRWYNINGFNVNRGIVMATYRIVEMYRKSKSVKGIHYDFWNEPIFAFRVDKRHSLLFGLIHHWDYGANDLSECFFCSISKAKEAILKVNKNRRVTILYK